MDAAMRLVIPSIPYAFELFAVTHSSKNISSGEDQGQAPINGHKQHACTKKRVVRGCWII